MSLAKVLGYLQQAKEFLSSTAPDALERVAEIAGLVSEASKEAAEWFRSWSSPKRAIQGQGIENIAPQKMTVDELDDITSNFEAFADDISKVAALPPALIVAAQRKKKMKGQSLPASLQVVLAKTISAVTDKIVDAIHDFELPEETTEPEEETPEEDKEDTPE